MRSFTAASAAPSVELVSPMTSTASGLVLLQHRLGADQDGGRLFGVAPRADLEEEIGRFHPQLLVQQGIHRVVVMLPGIHREDTPGRRQRVTKRARLDGLRAGAVTECQGMGCVGFH